MTILYTRTSFVITEIHKFLPLPSPGDLYSSVCLYIFAYSNISPK